MRKGIQIILVLILAVVLSSKAALCQECTSPEFEYYMGVPVASSCAEISLGVDFINPFDDLSWNVSIMDVDGNNLESVLPGTPFYVKILGTGYWGIGYMPHLYVPGNYSGVPMTWEQSWLGIPEYTGSASGDIVDLDDIANRNPITVYEPNLVVKTPLFASATGDNTLIVAQEQVFLGWWGGPWTEPDYEIITWVFGPFQTESAVEFILRTLMSPVYNDEMYVSDNSFIVTTSCVDADLDGYYQEAVGCLGPYDCNDFDPTVNPGVSEIAGNSIDEDCDGVAACDPNLMKNPGQYTSCMAKWKN